MRLTKFTDYALRVLLLAAARDGTRTTVGMTAEIFGISEAHVKKVVHHLISAGYLSGARGRAGGFELKKDPSDINLGAVIRLCEADFGIFECMAPRGSCLISGVCALPGIGSAARDAFLAVYDKKTLSDILLPASAFDRANPSH
ncbi:RrF2 family transcriptional regulator [Oceanicella actignis]|uniref:RrF2 family transcriptional regulator n=1 Tax=Oceanicella actignis TaxID=1189325 RepID=UPI0011E7D13B|nr:Rrf2 family transcriptional regulator [Oceanicella actignis]TYO84567.1 BadM/Rrf2 family transcriptional regulator [Oceanicella actignis]